MKTLKETSIANIYSFTQLSNSYLTKIENMSRVEICDLRNESQQKNKIVSNPRLEETIYACYLAYQKIEFPNKLVSEVSAPNFTINPIGEIITWAIITSMSKKTYAFKKATNNVLGKNSSPIKNQSWLHFSNRQKAEIFIADLKTKGTQFAVILITDNQFGKMEISYNK
ncbi:MAG: hypothetical protein ABI067_08355 [Leifsonia sp.]|jgi:hypothetical protein